ncbi:MAG: acetate--CoA ligase family protein [Nocardiopsaceae bacterium]|jgi:acyl-CoA synthetase (NDP forming)|nr:acetate--CoA ligase family protein [Nocardiopsaceae bacterium]
MTDTHNAADGITDTDNAAGTDQGWAAPPLAPPRRRTSPRHRTVRGERGQPPDQARLTVSRGRREPDSVETQPSIDTPAPTPAPTLADLVSPERLAQFFAPRHIAVVGASPTSAWARFVQASAAAVGFTGELTPVHPRHKSVFGVPAVPSLSDLAEPADLAFIMAPTDAVEEVLDDAAAAGVRGAVVLAAGYRETGDKGRVLEERLVNCAVANGITLLGPNCLGFLNAHAKAGPYALTVPLPLHPGPVGIAMQSGALASVMLSFARSRAIGLSTVASLGNEALITASDMMNHLIDDEDTQVICLFLEQIGDPAAFAAAAARADRAGKPIVALKAGSSAAGSEAALAHTGSIAGDDAVVDAVLRQLNVIRVTSIEELLTTGALLGHVRRPAGRRMGVLTASGGACDIIADQASDEDIEIPEFAPSTTAAIEEHVPPFAQVRNPLDVTGYFLANQRTSALTAIDHALDAAVEDPGLDFVFFTGLTLPDSKPPDETVASLLDERVAWLGQRMTSSPVPVIPVGYTCVDVTPFGRDLLGRNGIHLVGGIDLGVQAIGSAIRWAEGRGRTWPGPDTRATQERQYPQGAWRETEARELLESFGVPLVPGEMVQAMDEAGAAAKKLGYPVALRICSAGIPHKSDIGGVALDLRNIVQLRSGFKKVRLAGEAAEAVAAAEVVAESGQPVVIDGVMVSPMRTGGVELLVGISVDPTFGPVLAVGLGGVFVEVLGDVSLRALPVSKADVIEMLGELRGAPLLRGVRGHRPVDLDRLAGIIMKVADAALSLGGALSALELNPLWVNGDQIEALDVLVVTSQNGQTKHDDTDQPDQAGQPDNTPR